MSSSTSCSTIVVSDTTIRSPTPLSPTPPRHSSTSIPVTLHHSFTPLPPPPRSSVPSPALSHHSYIPCTQSPVLSSTSSHSPFAPPQSIPRYSLTSGVRGPGSTVTWGPYPFPLPPSPLFPPPTSPPLPHFPHFPHSSPTHPLTGSAVATALC